MDYDIDMEDASGQYQEAPQEAPVDDLLDIQEPGEIDEPKLDDIDLTSTNLVPNKVHIRGLDALTPDDIKAYIIEHVGSGTKRPGSVPYDRIEWIDDTSANLVFSSDDTAAAALVALADVPTEISDVANLPIGELIKAKTYSAKTEDVSAGLFVRFAVESDKKQVGAAARSRFYLLHPEYDPEERRRNRRRSDYRDSRDGRGSRDYRDRRRDVQDDREADIRNNSFDVNLYDDDGPSRARRRRSHSRSRSRSRSRSPRRANRDKELFAFDTLETKELFPQGERDLFDSTKLARRDYRDRDDDRNDRDRNGRGRNDGNDKNRDRNRDSNRDRDSGRLRDRSLSPPSGLYSFDEDDYDGRLADARAEAAAEAAARNRDKARAIRDILASGDNVAEHDSSVDNSVKELFADDSRASVSASLSDRITRPSDSADKGLNIRGISNKGKGDLGISIKGIASARELFPSKLNDGGSNNGNGNGNNKGRGRNGGKDGADLASRITRPRQRAEDLFR